MSSIFHICKSLNRTFTFEEWCDYCNNHRDRDEIVFRYCDFGFNICDVCLTPHIKVKWQGKAHNRFMIETAQSPNGRWSFGIGCIFATQGIGYAARYIADENKGYPTEKEAVYIALLELERKAKVCISVMPDCEYDEETETVISCTSKVANIKVALKEIEKYKEIYNPKQLTLFDL